MGLLDGMLGTSMNDPRTAAILALSGNMVRGDFGGGLLGAGQAYQQAQDASLKRQMTMMQLAQAKQQFEMSQPILQAIVQKFRDAQGGSPVGPAVASQPAIAPMQGGPLGSGTNDISVGGQAAVSAPAPAPAPAGGGSVFGVPLDLAGLSVAGEGLPGLAKLAGQFNAPTDFVKTLRAAGIDPDSTLGRQMIQGNIAKQNYIAPTSLRPGGYVQQPNGDIQQMPHVPDGAQAIRGADGQWHIVPVDGGISAMQAAAAASALGKTSGSLTQGVGPDGKPVFALGVPPGTVTGGGNVGGPAPAPAAFGPRSVQLNNQGNLALDPATAQLIAQDAARNGLTSVNVNFNAPSGGTAVLAGQSNSTPAPAASSPAPMVVRPGNAPGFNASQEALATANAKRFNTTIDTAADSPTRVNVLDNILALSQKGVQTGPTADFSNQVKGVIASLPGIGDTNLAKNFKGDVSDYQEISKFLKQNGIRAWQAAGGTGTDSQLEANMQANLNNKMFPQALQAVGQWAKAGELALQGKANAMQNWKDQNGGNVANLDQFERMWRNNFDPILFQLKTMPDASAYVENLKATKPTLYQSLMLKASKLKELGAL